MGEHAILPIGSRGLLLSDHNGHPKLRSFAGRMLSAKEGLEGSLSQRVRIRQGVAPFHAVLRPQASI